MESTTSIFIQGLLFNFAVQLIPIFIIVLLAWAILSKIAKKFERQNEERLQLERENSAMLTKRLDELNGRLVVIEKMLKEVE